MLWLIQLISGGRAGPYPRIHHGILCKTVAVLDLPGSKRSRFSAKACLKYVRLLLHKKRVRQLGQLEWHRELHRCQTRREADRSRPLPWAYPHANSSSSCRLAFVFARKSSKQTPLRHFVRTLVVTNKANPPSHLSADSCTADANRKAPGAATPWGLGRKTHRSTTVDSIIAIGGTATTQDHRYCAKTNAV